MNKKRLSLITMLMSVSLSVFATDFHKGLSTGGMAIIESNNTGGSAELGFPLFTIGKLTFRNHILFTGFGYNDGGVFALGDKILIGGITERGMRPYSFIESHVGIYRDDSKDFLELPLYFDLKVGGGMDVYANEKLTFFMEVGGGITSLENQITGTAHIGAGFRTFWN